MSSKDSTVRYSFYSNVENETSMYTRLASPYLIASAMRGSRQAEGNGEIDATIDKQCAPQHYATPSTKVGLPALACTQSRCFFDPSEGERIPESPRANYISDKRAGDARAVATTCATSDRVLAVVDLALGLVPDHRRSAAPDLAIQNCSAGAPHAARGFPHERIGDACNDRERARGAAGA